MLMAEIMRDFGEISFICTSKTRFCILLDGTVVSPMSAFTSFCYFAESHGGVYIISGTKAEMFPCGREGRR